MQIYRILRICISSKSDNMLPKSLSSSSFINLENQEKIEQLIFTAKEIANVSVETEGFVNEVILRISRKMVRSFFELNQSANGVGKG